MRKSVHFVLSLLLATIGCLPSVYAADNKGGSEIISRFDRSFDSLDKLIFGEQPGPGIYTGDAIMGIQNHDTLVISPQLDLALRENTAAKIHEGNGLTGLQITGQTYYRIAGNGGVDEVDGETGQGFYRAKVQAEIRWYLLQSSIFGKEGRRKVADLEERIARAGYEKEKTDINEFQVKQNIENYYDSLLYGVLIHRVELLRLLDDAQRYLLGNENISSDDIVRTLNQLLDAERKLSEIEHKYPASLTLAGVRATTVRVDSAALVDHVARVQGDMKILHLRMQLLEQKEQNIKWWTELNVAPFVRYANYFRQGLPNTYNLDAGLTFTIPLNDEPGRRKRTLRSERDVLEQEEYRLSQRVADKTALVVSDVGRLDRASMSELKRIRELRGYIAQRTDAYRKGLGQHNRIARAQEYAMYIGCLERLIDYQYRRDCLIANLQSLLPDESILKFCHFEEIKD